MTRKQVEGFHTKSILPFILFGIYLCGSLAIFLACAYSLYLGKGHEGHVMMMILSGFMFGIISYMTIVLTHEDKSKKINEKL